MGTRYFLTVVCPKCEKTTEQVYYAPTCGINDFYCECGNRIDLEKYTGITLEEASNRGEIEKVLRQQYGQSQ